MLNKQGIDVSFAEGLDTKTDPKRVQMGRFVELENTVFQKGGLLQKRTGYTKLSSLPDTTYSYLTTFNDNLTAIGNNIAAQSLGDSSWIQKGSLQPLSLRTLPVIRNNLNQTACDIAVAPNGVACAVYLETDGSTTTNKYVVFDSITGQNISAPVAIPVASGVVTGGMRVFVVNNYFFILFRNVITATSHLQYIAVNTRTAAVVQANTDIAANFVSSTTLPWDAYVVGNTLYVAYNTTSGGQAIKVAYLTSNFALSAAVTFAASIGTMVSVTADISNPASPIIWVSFYDSSGTTGYSLAVDQSLNTVLAATQIISTGAYLNITSVAQNGVLQVFAEKDNSYASPLNATKSNFVHTLTVTQAGVVSALVVSIRSVGLASKAFLIDGVAFYLAAYQSTYQPTYFLINGTYSTSASPIVSAKLAYENGGGYLAKGLPGVTVNDGVAQVGYLFKDLIQAVNKGTAVPTGTQTAGIYSQTGINLASFTAGTASLDTAEIGRNLNISGGFLWLYDGYLPVEQNFMLWPDTFSAVWSATGGNIVAQPDSATNANAYYYQITYEWTDNQGNAFRSAPSIPVPVTTTSNGTSGSIALSIPSLRLTMKTANPVKVVIYRWSVGQQNYYQTTSISLPTLNSTTADLVTYTDTLADASILGNNLIYTTGGVVEDVNAPASDLLTLYDTRLWLVNAEDRNQLWFSKQVIESTPVEMSDLFTKFIPETVGTATGEITAIAPMDDKLIISKGGNSLVYINGSGPDNTGANNQYSDPIFIASTVGCSNQKSLVLIPQGLMFQSDKGIWILGRDLQTNYIGAPVEGLTLGATVLSAVSVPETNQVRFTLDTGITLMYDYFYSQWGSFVGVPAVSSCIWQGVHTFINSYGAAYRQSESSYLDGSNPVLMKFKTGPLRVGDLQGYQRAYFFYLLGDYISPHKLMLSMSYDYSDSPSQSVTISPSNYSTAYGAGGSQSPYGQGNPYGGPGISEDWRVFLERQRCMAFQITLQEIFDASIGAPAGAGLTLSGLNVVCAFKKGFRPQAAAASAG